MAGRGSGRKLMVYLLAMTRLLGLTPAIDQCSRERPLARAVPAGTARHHCQGSRVVLPLWGLSAYFLPQKLLYVVYCRKKTLNDRQSRRVNQQSQWWHGLAGVYGSEPLKPHMFQKGLSLKNGVQSRGQNRTRESRPSGIAGGLAET